MVTEFVYASDETVTVDQSKITQSTWNYLTHYLYFDLECSYRNPTSDDDELSDAEIQQKIRVVQYPTNTISIQEFTKYCHGKLYAYITYECQQAWLNIAQAVSSSVTLYFMYEEGHPFYIELSSKYTVSKTNQTLLRFFPPPIVHILSNYSLETNMFMGIYEEDDKWIKKLRPNKKGRVKEDILKLYNGTLSIKKYKQAVNKKQIKWRVLNKKTNSSDELCVVQ